MNISPNSDAVIGVLDFGTGIVTGLVASGCEAISWKDFEKNTAAAFPAFQEAAENENLRLTFHVSLDRLHGDSPTVRQAIGHTLTYGLSKWDEGVLILDIVNETENYFESLPGSKELWVNLAMKIRGEL